MNEKMSKIGKLILAELREANSTVEDLAEFTQLDLDELLKIIEGVRKPTVAEGIAIADFFDISPMIMIGGRS
jgi:plasmid maintenance system antidote protein VapI